MDTQVSNTIVTVRKTGNLPEALVSFFDKEKPEIKVDSDSRVAFLRFKTDKKAGTKRENMAVLVPRFNADLFTSKSQHDFLCELINNYQDSVAVRVADSEVTWEQFTSLDWLIQDFNDTSRDSSGRKVTKETIAEWFNQTVAKTVEIRAKTKNAQMTPETVQRVITGYREMFQKFTGYGLVNMFTDPQLELLRTLMVSTEFTEDDPIAEYVLTKMDKITKEKVAQDSLIDAI